MLAQLPLSCLVCAGETEEVGPERTELGFLPGVVFLDYRAAARRGGVR